MNLISISAGGFAAGMRIFSLGVILTAQAISRPAPPADTAAPPRTRIIVDSDANNELDDQHAIAYVLLNPERFEVEGITVNRTAGGGDIERHAREAERVVRLCGRSPAVRVYRGASGSFDSIRPALGTSAFDGHGAVDFIIRSAHRKGGARLVILAIGKLTNVGLALCKDPSIVPRVRVVWLGTNYPASGEYNFENDTAVVNYVLGTAVDLEVAVVRYGDSTGTGAVQVSIDEIRARLGGKGPRVAPPVVGRYGGTFTCFGDYSIDLFAHVKEKTRSLFDLAAAAIVKNPRWARPRTIPAPRFESGRWIEQGANPRRITLWESYDRNAIIGDLEETMERATHALPREGGAR